MNKPTINEAKTKVIKDQATLTLNNRNLEVVGTSGVLVDHELSYKPYVLIKTLQL